MALPAPKRPTRGLNNPGSPPASAAAEAGGKSVKKAKGAGKPARKPNKKEEHRAQWSGANLRRNASALLRGAMEAAAKESGDDSTCVAGKMGRLVLGIPFPALCLEYLVQNNVLRLGIVVQVVGQPGVCKSGFLFDMVRWFANSGGLGSLIENEDKYSPTWAMSIIGDQGDDVLGYEEASSVEDWQARLLGRITYFKKAMTGTKENPGSGRVFPIVFLLDSLMGKPSEETMASIHEAGFASRAHPVEALKITPYLKTLATELKRWPFVFAFTNHLKMSKDQQGRNERRKGGGALKEFQESLEFEISKIKSDSSTTKYKGMTLQIECRKNSVGDTGNKIVVDIRWTKYFDKAKGKLEQTTVWRWNEATIRLLHGYAPGSELGKLIRDVVDVNKGSGDAWWSKKLGVRKEKMIGGEELGAMLHARTDLVEKLRPLLGIEVRETFQPGNDYREQRQALLDGLHREMEAL